MYQDLCDPGEVCKQDWNSDLDELILQCCDTSNDQCRVVERPRKTLSDFDLNLDSSSKYNFTICKSRKIAQLVLTPLNSVDAIEI